MSRVLSQITPLVSIVANTNCLRGASLKPGKASHPDGRIRAENGLTSDLRASAAGFLPLRLRNEVGIHATRI